MFSFRFVLVQTGASEVLQVDRFHGLRPEITIDGQDFYREARAECLLFIEDRHAPTYTFKSINIK